VLTKEATESLIQRLVDGRGFEPRTSAMPTPKMGSEYVFKPYEQRILRMENKREYNLRIENVEALLAKFKDFMRINMQLRPSTVLHTIEDIKRFLKRGNNNISYKAVSNYLKGYLKKAPKTYNQQITSLRRFIRDFLGTGHIISSFKLAPVDEPKETTDITKAQVRKGFYAQKDALSKAIYLFTATTGLRKSEILSLLKENIDFETRTVRPKHFTRKKRSGVTFYSEGAEKWLKKYLNQRKDNDPRLFLISDRKWKKIWKRATEAADAKITAQVLRLWFSTEMGELGVPDRYVDVFQGRVPRTVIAKHYTGKGFERLKRIYDKANLKVLS
jgi:integrase